MATKVLTVHTDGSCKNVKGMLTPMGIGIVIKLDGELKYSHGGYGGEGTNNVAEWAALLHAVKWVHRNVGYDDMVIRFFCDNQMVVRQVLDQYSHAKFKAHYTAVTGLVAQVRKRVNEVTIHWIPREQNTEADALAGQGRIEWLQGKGR